jgi:hypothetical protein
MIIKLIAKILLPLLKNHIKNDKNVIDSINKLDTINVQLNEATNEYIKKHGEDNFIKEFKKAYKL